MPLLTTLQSEGIQNTGANPQWAYLSQILMPIVADLRAINQAAGSGGGNVVGTPPSTDNAVARYDGITGLLIQNSLATISDTGTVNIPAGETYNINGVPVGGTGTVTSVNSGTDITVDNTDPANPIVNYSGTGFLKTDGTTNGATSQAQQFDLGVTANTLLPTINRGMDVNGIYISDTHNTASMASDGTVQAESNDNSTKTVLNPDGSITYVGKSGSVNGTCTTGFKKIHITSAQIQTGNSVPIVLIPAQGAGTVISAMVNTKARNINGVVPLVAGGMDIKSAGASVAHIFYGGGFIGSTTANPIIGDTSGSLDSDDCFLNNAALVAVFDHNNLACDAEIDIYLIYQILTL